MKHSLHHVPFTHSQCLLHWFPILVLYHLWCAFNDLFHPFIMHLSLLQHPTIRNLNSSMHSFVVWTLKVLHEFVVWTMKNIPRMILLIRFDDEMTFACGDRSKQSTLMWNLQNWSALQTPLHKCTDHTWTGQNWTFAAGFWNSWNFKHVLIPTLPILRYNF